MIYTVLVTVRDGARWGSALSNRLARVSQVGSGLGCEYSSWLESTREHRDLIHWSLCVPLGCAQQLAEATTEELQEESQRPNDEKAQTGGRR